MTHADSLADDVLIELETPPPVSLADKFGFPPVSVLDRRSGAWQDRKRKWLSLGLKSEMGRTAGAFAPGLERSDFFARAARGEVGSMGTLKAGGISIFDPVIAEMAYRWWSKPGDVVLDPFAGGSVRGIVASTLARPYVGIDISSEQVEANRAQTHLGSEIAPEWIAGDSTRLPVAWDGDADLIFTCPPYADLEVYSDHPRDISAWTWEDFLQGQQDVIRHSAALLRRDRFAVWVTSDIRDRRGAYRGLVGLTIQQFAQAGMTLQSDAVILDPVGMAAMRAERVFRGTRRLTRVHQHMLVFVKGDAGRATRRIEDSEDFGGGRGF